MTNNSTPLPRPEHPRPDFKRELWLNLNGTWNFDFDPQNEGEKAHWQTPGTHKLSQKINVPYPWQAPLSGIEKPDYHGAAWYSREITVPADWNGKRAILKFGAVDWEAKIWINGQFAGEHAGGYSAFEIDITDFVEFGKPATLTLRAFDPEDITQLPAGKQHHWYTRTSGIWQTVYLEARNAVSIAQCHITPDVDRKKADFALKIAAPDETCGLSLEVKLVDSAGKKLKHTQRLCAQPGETAVSFSIPIPDPQLWSPESPALYEVTLTLKQADQPIDTVETYFGMRKIEAKKWNGNDFEYVFLNDKPVYLRGALNQSFHPDGIYTYPSEEVIKRDLELTKEWGFNFLRIHIKVDEPLYYYWAAKLGVMIMYDLPNFDDPGYGPAAKARYEQMLRDAIARDYNHPSIIIWCLFNETWGLQPYFHDKERQAFVENMFHLTKSLDKTRLVDDMSPCHDDHLLTDVFDWHFYIYNYAAAKKDIQHVVDSTFPGSRWCCVPGAAQTAAPLFNGEYGGIGCTDGDRDIGWCFKHLTNEQRLHEKICGYIYTELMDIEWEYNGMMRYDRSLKDFGYDPRLLNADDVVLLDTAPEHALKPGENLSFESFTSFWSDEDHGPLTLKWALAATDPLGNPLEETLLGSRPVEIERYRVKPAGKIVFTAPQGVRTGILKVWIENAQSEPVAENFITLAIDAKLPAEPDQQIVPFRPASYRECNWTGRVRYAGDIRGWKHDTEQIGNYDAANFWAEGAGLLRYELPAAALEGATGLRVRFEAAAEEPGLKQTNEDDHPTDLTVSVEGIELATVLLPDAPNDIRGIVSRVTGFRDSKYGYLVDLSVPAGKLAKILSAAKKKGTLTLKFEVKPDAKNQSGLVLFAKTAGRFGIDPMLIVEKES